MVLVIQTILPKLADQVVEALGQLFLVEAQVLQAKDMLVELMIVQIILLVVMDE
jgi:hypothetical protein